MAPGQNIDIADLPPELKDANTKSTSALSWQDALASDVMNPLNRGEQQMLETRTKYLNAF